MSRKMIDLTGQKFNHLTVLKFDEDLKDNFENIFGNIEYKHTDFSNFDLESINEDIIKFNSSEKL